MARASLMVPGGRCAAERFPHLLSWSEETTHCADSSELETHPEFRPLLFPKGRTAQDARRSLCDSTLWSRRDGRIHGADALPVAETGLRQMFGPPPSPRRRRLERARVGSDYFVIVAPQLRQLRLPDVGSGFRRLLIRGGHRAPKMSPPSLTPPPRVDTQLGHREPPVGLGSGTPDVRAATPKPQVGSVVGSAGLTATSGVVLPGSLRLLGVAPTRFGGGKGAGEQVTRAESTLPMGRSILELVDRGQSLCSAVPDAEAS
jgi:hypothetical protein